MSDKKSFVMYENWAIMLANLPKEQAGELIKAICSMQIGQEYEIKDPVVQAIYLSILPKMQEDAEAYADTRQKRSKAAEKRWGSANAKSQMQVRTEDIQNDANALQVHASAEKKMQMEGDTDTVTDTDKYLKEKKENTKETKESPFDESEPPASGIEISNTPFDTFWDLYPKKVSKRAALGAWQSAVIAEDPRVIISGLKRVIELQWSKWPNEKRQFIPNAANWLKNWGWKDEVQPYVSTARDRPEILPAYYTKAKNNDPDDPRNKPLAPEELKAMKEKLKRFEEEANHAPNP